MNLFGDSRDWLGDKTGKDAAYWVARVQALIQECSTPVEGSVHFTTNTEAVLTALVKEIVNSAPVAGGLTGIPTYDENMYAFSILAQVAALWYSRVQTAKLADPRRPVGNGMKVYRERYLPWLMGMYLLLADTSRDATYFPGQEWQNPFTPGAKSGDFI